jgi:hypothetical protein
MNGIIKCHFGKHMTTDTKLWIHNITSKAALCHGSEVWIINKRNAQKLEVVQMRFLRPLLGLTRLDRQRNFDIRNRLKADNILEDIISYQKNWIDHLKRMDRNRIPKLASQYQPRGRLDLDEDGETRNALKEQVLRPKPELRSWWWWGRINFTPASSSVNFHMPLISYLVPSHHRLIQFGHLQSSLTGWLKFQFEVCPLSSIIDCLWHSLFMYGRVWELLPMNS